MQTKQSRGSKDATDQALREHGQAIGARVIRFARWLFAWGERLQGVTESERLGLVQPAMPNKLFESRDGALVLLPSVFGQHDEPDGAPVVALKLAEYPQVVVVKLGVDDAARLGTSLTVWASAHQRERAHNAIGYTGAHLRAIRGGQS